MKKKKDYRNVLAIYSLSNFAGREHFSGILDAMSNTSDWHLNTARPERLVENNAFVNQDGEPYDGFIISLPGSDDAMEIIAGSHAPTVLVDIIDRRFSARCETIATVWTDNADIGRRGARHLIERGGYACAGYVHELRETFYSTERMTAFRTEMRKVGIKTQEFAGWTRLGESDFFNRLRRWIRDLPKPAAVMATSDMRAADVVNACKAEGIPVPSQVSVVGVDHDISQHARCGMSISSVIQNSRMMGRQAVRELEFLFAHPNWKGRPHEVLIPAKGIFAGETTSRSIAASRLVKMALDFIHENHRRAISPKDVVSHLGCSRRLGELRFSQIAGMTIRMAIEKARMEEVQRRLQSGERVKDIVKSQNFTSANQLYRIYKRHFGRTIRQSSC